MIREAFIYSSSFKEIVFCCGNLFINTDDGLLSFGDILKRSFFIFSRSA